MLHQNLFRCLLRRFLQNHPLGTKLRICMGTVPGITLRRILKFKSKFLKPTGSRFKWFNDETMLFVQQQNLTLTETPFCLGANFDIDAADLWPDGTVVDKIWQSQSEFFIDLLSVLYILNTTS